MAKQSPTQKKAENSSDASADKVVGSAKGFFSSIRAFMKDRVSILDNAKPTETIEGIERDIEFKGFNIWILIVAIVIASVGLNANSTAVVIGAMLISPLMGPIMGIGLSVGINDFNMLKRGLRNLAIAVGVSIVTSTLFFFIIPINDVTSELFARTRPDIRDVLIAFFGGLAGILAGSRKEKNNVVPGVAIATALMPPLCTAGFGLATLQFNYLFGAAYLFLINAFFIALATVIVVRYLRFPVRTFVDSATENRTRRLLVITTIIMMVPASIIFYNVVVETIAKRNIMLFVDENITPLYGKEIDDIRIEVTDSSYIVSMVKYGDPIPMPVVDNWKKQITSEIKKSELVIFQGSDREANQDVSRIMDMYTSTQHDMATKEQMIAVLQEKLKQYEDAELPANLLEEIKINYPEVASVSMGRMVYTDYIHEQKPASPNFFVYWQPTTQDTLIPKRMAQLNKWLSTRFVADSVIVTSLGKLPLEVPKEEAKN